jgi:hypothetical protein
MTLMTMYTVFIVQAYQTSQYAVTRGGIFLGKWRSSFAGTSHGKINVQSACALNTRYIGIKLSLCQIIEQQEIMSNIVFLDI